jgi:hypothetical protein
MQELGTGMTVILESTALRSWEYWSSRKELSAIPITRRIAVVGTALAIKISTAEDSIRSAARTKSCFSKS